MNVTVVTVTYGTRWRFLEQVLSAAKREGVAQCVVVDNGSLEPISQFASDHFGAWATTISTGGNLGSATAYRLGLQQALMRGGEYILLLDDDNILCDGALRTLESAYDSAECQSGGAALAVLGYREHSADATVRQILNGTQRRAEGSCLGFHVLDISKKIIWRFSRRSQELKIHTDQTIPLPWAPYGGLFFHKSLIGQIGFPNEAFVLYQDDVEFTNRITKQGGSIRLIPQARIIDAEESWNLKAGHASSFSTWLTQGTDFQVFYTFRNSMYFEWHVKSDRSPWYLINMVTYISILTLFAIWLGRFKRYALLMRAAYLGVRGKLGIDIRYPLPK
jgi:GT2 family glycosyltransferase